MSLPIGTRIGPYAVSGILGAGGMGEVYRATDATLDREVAIKVLPDGLAGDPERLARFEREARTLAGLNHPHIAHVYGFERAGGVHALVMELVDGQTLDARIAAGPLPPDEALVIARQIADALEAAHGQGIVHRDLKPSNVALTLGDQVKVLDFGLAKSIERAAAPAATQATQSPTLMSPAMTQAGMILGTAAYMSPEQARGRAVDKRADIWAFGCVLYEMLTGRRAFEGEDITETLAAVMRSEPDLGVLPAAVPARVRQALQVCLRKDVRQRASDIHDVTLVLDGAFESPISAPAGVGVAVDGGRWRSWKAIGATATLAAALAGAAGWTLRPDAPVADLAIARVTIALPAGDELGSLDGNSLALSPDGATLVYVGVHDNTRQLFVRTLASLDAKALPGTDNAEFPFFSPDGGWVGFFAQGKLKKAAVAGGAVQVLADARVGRGGTWGPDGTIYFAPVANAVSGLWRVSAAGGAASEVTTLDRTKGEISHRWPQVLPGGQSLLFSVRTGPSADQMRVEVLTLQTGERRVLVEGAESGHYVSTGHLVYANSGTDTLMAVPMDLGRLEVATTAPVVLAERVRVGGEGAVYAVSDAGHLVYARGGAERLQRRLVWTDRRGNAEAVAVPTRRYSSVALSPDGRMAAIGTEGDAHEIWIYDFARSTQTRLNVGGSSQGPVWAPDGAHVAYRATRSGSRNVFWTSVDNTSPEQRLTEGEGTESPASFSPDGKLLAFSRTAAAGGDIRVLSVDGDRTPYDVVAGEGDQRNAQFSPDGRWLAYVSTESGRTEVYVQPFPGPGRKWLMSTDGGVEPRWSRNGRELFYRSGDKFMVVAVNTTPAFSAGSPQLLFQGRGIVNPVFLGYDVSLDGQRLLVIEPVASQSRVTEIDVVMNWSTELKRLVPAK